MKPARYRILFRSHLFRAARTLEPQRQSVGERWGYVKQHAAAQGGISTSFQPSMRSPFDFS
jgi:hypothetical protein